MQPELSIIIVSYQTRDLLDRCLASIVKSNSTISYEVIVVDNGSQDESVDLVREKYPEIRLFVNQTNLGFARANNQALASCSGQYALLLNSDTEVLGGALDAMCHYMQSNPQAGVLGAQLLNSDCSLQPSGNKVPSLYGEIARLLPIRKALGLRSKNRFYDSKRDYAKIVEVDEVSGACLFVRRSVWETIGLLDEAFFFYFEDVDFCMRARKAGWKIVYLPQAQVLHHWGRSTKTADAVLASKMLLSHIHFIRKVHGIGGEFVIRVVFVLLTTAKILVGVLASVAGITKYRQFASVNCRLLRVSLGLRA
jgi:GT2 family glycosyltransferase